MPQKQKLKPEEKVTVIKRYLKGEISYNMAGQMLDVNRETIRRWVAQYEAEGVEAFLPHDKNHVYRAKR